MIRKLMASSAILALMSAGAMTIAQAQTDPAAPPVVDSQAAVQDNSTNATPVTELAASEQTLTPEQPTLATAFIGRSVYSSEDPESDNIGDVNDLIVGEDGTISHAVIGVGGFLGMGEKDVAVPFDELQVVERDGDIRLIYSATREQLEAAPAFDRTAYDPGARAAAEQTASTESTAPGATDPVMPAPSGDLTAAPAGEATADNAVPPPSDATTAPAEEQTAATEEPADATATPPTDQQTAATEEPAADATVTPPTGEQTATADTDAAIPAPAAPADEQVAAADTKPAATSGEVTFLSFDPAQLRASEFLGKAVYGPDDQSIGEISDLILQDDGKTRAALIDVGGFLGVGEKTVAIPFKDIQAQATEEGAAPTLKVAMSKDELGQLPAVAKPAETATTEAPEPSLTQPSDQMAAGSEPPAAGTDPMVTGSVSGEPETYELATQDISASKLVGATVYGPDDATLGEVGDVVFDKEGAIQAIEVDVGGFLGFGEKPVAVAFDGVNVRTDANGNMLVMVNTTADQLNSAPAYQEVSEDAASVQ